MSIPKHKEVIEHVNQAMLLEEMHSRVDMLHTTVLQLREDILKLKSKKKISYLNTEDL